MRGLNKKSKFKNDFLNFKLRKTNHSRLNAVIPGLNNEKELEILKKLDKPKKIQDFLDNLEINFEPKGDTCMSPRMVLNTNKAHCVEGAMLAALALRLHGHKPLLVDMTANNKDFDHVVAVFKKDGYWGAISKTNHGVLRYRDPIYKTIRELVLSYFNEYFLDSGKKTLRSYSNPVDLSMFDKKNWMTSEKDVWCVPEYLSKVRHFPIVSRSQIAYLRKADPIEVELGRIIEWENKDNKAVRNIFSVSKKDRASI